MNTAAAKIPAVSILLNRAEGLTAECGAFRLDTAPHGASAWERAEALLFAWKCANIARGMKHADKVDFAITYDDGTIYEGMLTLGETLADHVTREVTFWSGTRCPCHMTAEKYARLLETMTTAESRESKAAFLATYAIG